MSSDGICLHGTVCIKSTKMKTIQIALNIRNMSGTQLTRSFLYQPLQFQIQSQKEGTS